MSNMMILRHRRLASPGHTGHRCQVSTISQSKLDVIVFRRDYPHCCNTRSIFSLDSTVGVAAHAVIS